MWPLKHPKAYGATRAQHVANAAMWLASVLVFGWAYVRAGHDAWKIIYLGGVFDLLMPLSIFTFIGSTLAAIFMRESLVIGPDDVVLRKMIGQIRIRQDDIAGRRRSFVERAGHVDDIFSRHHPGVSIRVPLGIRRDTAFNMWLDGLTDLDGKG